MARSTYIYFVRQRGSGAILAAFTVKHEAKDWAEHRTKNYWRDLQLSSMRDGLGIDKTEKPIPWN